MNSVKFGTITEKLSSKHGIVYVTSLLDSREVLNFDNISNALSYFKSHAIAFCNLNNLKMDYTLDIEYNNINEKIHKHYISLSRVGENEVTGHEETEFEYANIRKHKVDKKDLKSTINTREYTFWSILRESFNLSKKLYIYLFTLIGLFILSSIFEFTWILKDVVTKSDINANIILISSFIIFSLGSAYIIYSIIKFLYIQLYVNVMHDIRRNAIRITKYHNAIFKMNFYMLFHVFSISINILIAIRFWNNELSNILLFILPIFISIILFISIFNFKMLVKNNTIIVIKKYIPSYQIEQFARWLNIKDEIDVRITGVNKFLLKKWSSENFVNKQMSATNLILIGAKKNKRENIIETEKKYADECIKKYKIVLNELYFKNDILKKTTATTKKTVSKKKPTTKKTVSKKKPTTKKTVSKKKLTTKKPTTKKSPPKTIEK